jgi:N-carbamoylputrescine amidase
MKTIKTASVQFNHHAGDKAYNLDRITSFVNQAAEENVELIIFPEMCITGYWHVRNLVRSGIESLAEPIPEGPSVKILLNLAKAHNMSIGAGLIERDNNGNFYNTYILAMPDGRYASHRKLHCFISAHMESGSEFTVFELPRGIKAGILICYDNNIIENVRITALMGAEILIAPHQTGGCHSPSPRCMGKIDPELWHNRKKNPKEIESEFLGPKGRDWLMHWLPARAHDNGLFLIYSNGVGLDDDEVRTGNAMIIDPYGDILTETWKADDDMVIAELDMRIRDHCTGQRWIKSRRPELYTTISESTGKEEDVRKVRFDFK